MNQNLTEKELKNQARILREYLESCGVAATHSQMLEGLSRVHGWRNLATARANFIPEVVEPLRVEHTEASTQNWVERILFLGAWWEQDLMDTWYAYPKGTTIDQTGELPLACVRRLPDEYRFKPESSRADHLYAELPALDYHGIPEWVSSSRKVEEDLVAHGMGIAKEGVTLRRRDRGDDGAENYWVVVRMPEHVSDALDVTVRNYYVSVLAQLIRDRAEDNEFAITRGTLADLAFEESDQADMGEPTEEELDALRREFGY
jgi:hypothetical protein